MFPFISCISKVNNTFVDNEEDLDIVMSMHNLLWWQLFYDIKKFKELSLRWSEWWYEWKECC